MKSFRHRRWHGSPALAGQGFTLIEIAMVLVIVGLLIGVGTALLGPLIKQAKYKQSLETVKAAKEAVIGFALNSGRLPTAAEVPAITKNVDAWNTNLFYYPDPALTGANLCCAVTSGFQVEDRCPTGQNCGTGDPCCKTGTAFIIYSLGENHADETDKSPLVPRFKILQYGTNYDDIVEYVDLARLRQELSCSAVEIRTSSLPAGTEDMAYNTQIQGFGGCTPYQPWSPAVPIGTSGLSLDAAGTISGTVNTSATPVGTLSACSNTIGLPNVTLKDAQGKTATKDLSILVYPQTIRITNSDLPSTTVGASVTLATLNGTGGMDSYTWSLSGNPLWLDVNPATGVLTVTNPPDPPGAGDYPFTAILSDTTCSTTSKAFSVRVNPVSSGGGSAPTCTLTGPAVPITPGQTADLTWAITNGPADGTFVPSSGTCTNFAGSNNGTCTTGSLLLTTAFTLTVTNADGSNNCSATVTVNPPSAPSCTLTASPGIVRYNQTTSLIWNITNGPADGVFAPTSGTCTNFTGSNSGTCTTAALTAFSSFGLTVTNAYGSGNCATSAYVGCFEYRVWNNTGATRRFLIDGTCRNVNNNAEITTAALRLNVGETIQRWSAAGSCTGSVVATIDYDTAMNADITINGGNGNCQVNFTGTDR